MGVRKNVNRFFCLCVGLVFVSCAVYRSKGDDSIPDGKYRSRALGSRMIYLQNHGDSLAVYKLSRFQNDLVADTGMLNILFFPPRSGPKPSSLSFNATTFDFDALAIPFKYRPETTSLPAQFTTSLNGAIFFGVRNDNYKIRYKKHILNYYRRTTRHYAISLGGFTGFGSTAMSPWVTNNNIVSEYEGVVWLKGVAVIMGIGNFTSGLSIGWDNLLDKNNSYWIYENKPWIGLVFGLNLN